MVELPECAICKQSAMTIIEGQFYCGNCIIKEMEDRRKRRRQMRIEENANTN